MGSKVLVVGGAGYVGSVLVRELLERGYAVRVLDRLYFGDHGIKEVMDRIELVIGDMRTVDERIFEDVMAVINLGGLSNDPTAEYNPKANYEMNTEATYKLAVLAKKNGVRRYILASSCSIYDRGVFDEKADVVLDEESPVYPKAAYSTSKLKAEEKIRELIDDGFSPVFLRKGTIYGFSPRMRYDLVVNTFVKDALSKGYLTVFYGGEMWRPLVDVRDACRAYIACLQVPEESIKGQIINIAYRNFRISELGLRVRETLRELGYDVDIKPDYTYRGVRSYRVSAEKAYKLLNWRPEVTVEDSVKDMVEKIEKYGYTDFSNPRYYNIGWMKLLEEAQQIISITGSVFEAGSEIRDG